MNVTVWNEFKGQDNDAVKAAYPKTMHEAIKRAVESKDVSVTAVTMEMPHQGLSDELLEKTDVLIWWGHCHHGDVSDELVEKIKSRVLRGMGIIFLHSAHMSKPFIALMGTSCTLGWREAAERERLWTVSPAHPIANGVPVCTVLEHEETYSEPFDIPEPDETVFIGWFKGGNVFRSGVTYRRGLGKVFYFQPGHETHPTYRDENVKKILRNAVRWAYNPDIRKTPLDCPMLEADEK